MAAFPAGMELCRKPEVLENTSTLGLSDLFDLQELRVAKKARKRIKRNKYFICAEKKMRAKDSRLQVEIKWEIFEKTPCRGLSRNRAV